MNDLIRTIEELEAHAREWLDFSHQTYGWDTREYGDYVRCYFADTSEHRSVRLGEYGCQIQFAFHRPVQFGDMTLATVKHVDQILQRSREILAAERETAVRKSESEVEADKQARIDTLRRELAELEGAAAPEVAP